MVEKQIEKELANGRYVITEDQPIIVSALGALPKSSGGIRLIHDASRPTDNALNDFCPKEEVKYQTLQMATDMMKPHSYLCKVDLQEAYRSVKIHKTNYRYTGLAWNFSDSRRFGEGGYGRSRPTFMYDSRLCFGSRRAPHIFNELTKAVARMMNARGFPGIVVFLDDFLIIEHSKERCELAMTTLLRLLRKLGFSINYSKLVPPCKNLVFLGVEIDTVKMSLQLPQEKLSALKTELQYVVSRNKVTKRELQKLAGRLNWATQCIYGGAFHLRRIHDKIAVLKQPWHRSRVNADMRADIDWWLSYLETFNGSTKILDPRPLTPMFTDACPIAAGAVFGSQAIHFPWSNWPDALGLHINFLETLAVELALTRWATCLRDRKVLIHCDNQCAVGILNRGSSKNPVVMASLRRIFWMSVQNNFKIIAQYIPGVDNRKADLASRAHVPSNKAALSDLGLTPDIMCFQAMMGNFVRS